MRVLITAGPTRERIDAVRFLSNRSTGKMGYALAEAAHAMGHDVTLVSGPVSLAAPEGVRLVRVESAREMAEAVLAASPEMGLVIMAAAVADYRPVTASNWSGLRTFSPRWGRGSVPDRFWSVSRRKPMT